MKLNCIALTLAIITTSKAFTISVLVTARSGTIRLFNSNVKEKLEDLADETSMKQWIMS
jgi:hypothetical protein